MDVVGAHLLGKKEVWATDATDIVRDSTLNEIVDIYTHEGYQSMIDDRVRNNAYQKALSTIHAKTGDMWLEIGPGCCALLTEMFLKSNPAARVISVEGNEKAYRSARSVLRDYGQRVQLLHGLTTDSGILTKIRKELAKKKNRFSGIFHELIGFFASSEGMVGVIHRFCRDLNLSDAPIRIIPGKVATFMAPGMFNSGKKNYPIRPSQKYSVFVDTNQNFMLVGNAPVSQLRMDSGGRGPKWMGGKAFEMYDFSHPLHPQMEQTRTLQFCSETDAVVNCFVCWIWCETVPDVGICRIPRTVFPYGDGALGNRNSKNADFSSCSDDGPARASNWRNAVLLLPSSISVRAGQMLTVESHVNCDTATLVPTYKFVVRRDSDDIHTFVLNNCYPEYCSSWD